MEGLTEGLTHNFKPKIPKAEQTIGLSVFGNGGSTGGFNINLIQGAVDVGASVVRIREIRRQLSNGVLYPEQIQALQKEEEDLIKKLQDEKVDLNGYNLNP